jgi:hypothetical protein
LSYPCESVAKFVSAKIELSQVPWHIQTYGATSGSNFIPGALPGTIRICSDEAKVHAPCWCSPYALRARAQ